MSSSLPPSPPTIRRQFKLQPAQWIGIPLLALLVVLALFNVLGPSQRSAQAQGDTLHLVLHYPERTRFGLNGTLELAVTNTSDVALQAVTVAVDRAYLNEFSNLTFVPEPTHITEQAYVLPLGEITASSTRHIAILLQADAVGARSGIVTVTAEGQPPLQITLSTIILP